MNHHDDSAPWPVRVFLICITLMLTIATIGLTGYWVSNVREMRRAHWDWEEFLVPICILLIIVPFAALLAWGAAQ